MTPALAAVSYLFANSNAGRFTNISMTRQRDTIESTARQLGAQIIAEFRDYTGAAHRSHRPGLERMLDHITARPVTYCLIYDTDRLTRDRARYTTITQRVTAAGAKLIAATGPDDTNTLASTLSTAIDELRTGRRPSNQPGSKEGGHG